MSVNFLSPFLIRCCCCCYWSLSSLYVLNIKSLSNMLSTNILLHSVECLLVFSMFLLLCRNSLIWCNCFYFYYFVFVLFLLFIFIVEDKIIALKTPLRSKFLCILNVLSTFWYNSIVLDWLWIDFSVRYEIPIQPHFFTFSYLVLSRLFVK